jgi:hypothetical protein
VRLLVYMRDGRTVYRIKGRGNLADLLRHDPAGEERSQIVERGIWNPETGEYVWTPGIRLRFIAKGSVGVVEEEMAYTREAA